MKKIENGVFAAVETAVETEVKQHNFRCTCGICMPFWIEDESDNQEPEDSEELPKSRMELAEVA